MSAHKKARVVATAKSGIVVSGDKRHHGGLYTKVWGLAGGGLFVVCLVGLGVFGWAHWHRGPKASGLAAQIASLQSQVKANAKQPGVQVDLYQQLAVACAKDGNMKCANDAQSQYGALTGPKTPGAYTTRAQVAEAAGDKQQAIEDYQKAITLVRLDDGNSVPPIDQGIIANLQNQIDSLKKDIHG